jgi:hypothetical protein
MVAHKIAANLTVLGVDRAKRIDLKYGPSQAIVTTSECTALGNPACLPSLWRVPS